VGRWHYYGLSRARLARSSREEVNTQLVSIELDSAILSLHLVRVRHVGLLAPIAALWCRLAFATRHNDDTRDAMAATIGVPNSCPVVVADVFSDA